MKRLLIIILIYGALVIGWIKGLVHFCQCDFEPSYKAEAIYGIGTVTGLNSILGWFDFGK